MMDKIKFFLTDRKPTAAIAAVVLCVVVIYIAFIDAVPNLRPASVEPAEWVVMTLKSNKYHRHGCSTLKRTKMMKVLYQSDAVRNGYEPCSRCKPDGTEGFVLEDIDPTAEPSQENKETVAQEVIGGT